jgi:hypothetical protein
MRQPDFEFLSRAKDLRPTEKWFFARLVHLCDDQGRLHRSVAYLHAHTGVSTGHTGHVIRHLNETGYIRATIAKTSRGHETWLLFLTGKGLLPEGEHAPRPKPPMPLPGPATLEAGNIRITIQVEPREET